MPTFNTLNEMNNYIPNCLICGKSMHFIVEGSLRQPGSKSRMWSTSTPVYIKMYLKDNILYSKNKKYDLRINIDTNEIIEGKELINNLIVSWLSVKKTCATCDFFINAPGPRGSVKKLLNFPSVEISVEQLNYTLKGGKRLQIYKYYHADTMTGEESTVYVDGKILPKVPLDLSKFRDLAHLNKRLSTIKVFQ